MDTMNALVWKGDGALSLERRPIPALQGPRDAIVRVTRSTICTSDLHIRSCAVPVPGPAWCWAMSSSGWWRPWETDFQPPPRRPGGRLLRELLRRLLVLPPGLCQQLHPRRLGARLPHRRLSGRVRPGALRRHRPHPIPDALSDEDALFVGTSWPAATGARSCAPSSPATRRWCWA